MYEAFDRIELTQDDNFLNDIGANAISGSLQKTQNDLEQNEKLVAFTALLSFGMLYFAPKDFCLIYSPILVVALLGMLKDEVQLIYKVKSLQEVKSTPLLELDDCENNERSSVNLGF